MEFIMGLLVLMEIALDLMETVMVLWVPTGIHSFIFVSA